MGVEGSITTRVRREITLPIKPDQKNKITAVYLMLNPVVFKYVLRRVSDYEAAQQIAADVFGNLVEAVNKGKGPRTNLPSFLFQTAKNLITDRERRNIKEDDQAEISERPTETQTLKNPTHMEDALTKKADLERIYKASWNLSDDQRHALFFQLITDYSVKETARIMGITENYVKVLRNRAKEMIKKELGRLNA